LLTVDFFFGREVPLFFRAFILLTSEFLTPFLFFFEASIVFYFGSTCENIIPSILFKEAGECLAERLTLADQLRD
jgi:hypothetical protein